MNTKKKVTTPRRAKSRAELRKQLARDIASIMANPETPSVLYEDIADALTNMQEDIGDDYWHSTEVIEKCLDAHLAKEAKRKGGAR